MCVWRSRLAWPIWPAGQPASNGRSSPSWLSTSSRPLCFTLWHWIRLSPRANVTVSRSLTLCRRAPIRLVSACRWAAGQVLSQAADPGFAAKVSVMRVAAFLFCLCPVLVAAGDTAGRKVDTLWSKLAQSIEAQDGQLDGVLGVAIVDLTSGREWMYHADEVFPTASTIKLAILAELYRQDGLAAQGKPGNARLSDRYTVRKQDIVADSAILENLTPGVTVLTNRDLAG